MTPFERNKCILFFTESLPFTLLFNSNFVDANAYYFCVKHASHGSFRWLHYVEKKIEKEKKVISSN